MKMISTCIHRFRILIGLSIAFLILKNTYCQNTHEQNTIDSSSFYKGYIKSYFIDTKDVLVAPVSWNGKDWITTLAIAGATGLLINQDKEINKFFQKIRTPDSDNFSKYGLEPFGRGIYSMGTMGLFYMHGLIFKNNRSKKVALLGLKAYLLTGGLTTIPKVIFCRHRPREENPPDPLIWDFPAKDINHLSFFSGHTSTIFAVATIISSEYKEYWWVTVISYSIAGLTGLSRIHDNAHWASDVFMGAAFGTAVGKLIYNKNNWKVKLVPYKKGDETGVLINIPIK